MCFILSITVFSTMSMTGFAQTNHPNTESSIAIEANQSVIKDYKFPEFGLDITVPTKSDTGICIKGDAFSDITMGLPSIVKGVDGITTTDNKVLYNSTDGNVTIAFQPMLESSDSSLALHTEILMKNSNAPLSYSFEYDLPDGYTMVKDSDYNDAYNYGDVYILDENDEIICTLQAPQAVDVNGNNVDCSYDVQGNKLIQTITPNINNSFPIIIKSDAHPDVTRTATITKSKVNSIITRINQDIESTNIAAYWIVRSTKLFFGSYAADINAITSWLIKPTHIKKLKARKSLYVGKRNNMGTGDKLKVVTVLKWKRHGSHDGAYRIYSEKLTIV